MKTFPTISQEPLPKKKHIGVWKKIRNVKKLLKKKDKSPSAAGAIEFSSASGVSSLMSENQTPSGWWMKGLAPELQQRQKKLDGNDLVNVSEIICSIPETQMEMAVNILDTTGSNMLHLACYNGTSLSSINYIFINCSNESRIKLVNSQDKEGYIPLHVAAQCLCRDKISFEEGMKVIERLFTVCPDTIHHINDHKETVMDLVYKYLRDIHTESIEYQRLYKLYIVLRSYCHQAYNIKKEKWETEGYTAPKISEASKSTLDTASDLTADEITQVSNTNATVL
ncbi:predicted protein [Chaetoceros tenuissimus]|uniref:Uncharacterized protein n=1 Tax=Chaetoceros tenuissimus TaxID=426638 RepID=A0AAD3CFM4_9STRA|nr:predicted protein [Chaetoceros tenuissimus]